MPNLSLFVESGQRFGRGVVVDPEVRTKPSRSQPNGLRGAILRCDCGNEYVASLYRLRSGHTRSCGCLVRETTSEIGRRNVRHGYSRTGGRHALASTWGNMLYRCENPRCHAWENYGGRGIRVCERWHDFAAFVEDIERLLGPRPKGMTLDRIDTNGNYEPGNVKWSTAIEQRANRRR